MAAKQKIVVEVITGLSGGKIAYTQPLIGNVLSIQYIKAASNPYADGVSVLVVGEDSGETIWSESPVNASVTRRPRLTMHDSGGSDEVVGETYLCVNERLKITVSSAGQYKTGTFVILVG